ncbi:MAG: 2-isopropylmalate synthase [Desulfovibrio sp.]|jgi:2-isopropylmalate synthase|nr:2-isopropylmalate synthase [Desulfovibrio sp.]MDD7476564.1 2-isopropylmalate synthase [Desulfovibrio sp.]MDY5485783.1 2-isopropylmalate synthase [Desulfovibrio sp.]MEE0405699.1 2-isopropylmalate synthase [Desulfovibrio sp.]
MASSNRVIFFDTTLRDGEQSPGCTMNHAEKLRIAHQLEILGVDVIEAGFPASSQGDFDSVQAIAKQAGDNIQICGLARCMEKDIRRCWEAISVAKNPRIHTFLATSDLHMKYKLRKTPEQVIEMIKSSVSLAASLTSNVEFSCEDASRSDKDFLCRACGTAISAGATTINLPDTVGYAEPDEFAQLVKYVIENTPGADKAIFAIHCHDDLGLGVANTLAALRVGARQAEVTLCGIGERAGNTSLEEVAMNLAVRKDYYGLESNIVSTQLYPSCRLLSMTIGQPIPHNKAIIGANAFAHESGIHQDGMLKNRQTYEIMTPQSVGRDSTNLVIGKHSGRNAVRSKFESMGYKLDDEQLQTIFEAVKDLSDRKKKLYDEDLMALVQDKLYRMPDSYRLSHVSVSSSDAGGVPPTAAVLMDVDGIEKSHAGFGVGPIDAVFNVIADMVGRQPELEQYSVNAITGGTDAMGEVTVRIAENGFSAIGRGAHPDIIVASAKAYVNALNHLVQAEKEGHKIHCQLDDENA